MSSRGLSDIYENVIRHNVWWRNSRLEKHERSKILAMNKGDKIIFLNTPEKEFCYVYELKQKPMPFKKYPQDFKKKLRELEIKKSRIVMPLTKPKKISLFLDESVFDKLKSFGVFKTAKYKTLSNSLLSDPRREIKERAYKWLINHSEPLKFPRIKLVEDKLHSKDFDKFLSVLNRFLLKTYYKNSYDYVMSEEKRLQFLLIESLVDKFDYRITEANPIYEVSWEDTKKGRKGRYDITILKNPVSGQISLAAEIKVFDTKNPNLFLDQIDINKKWSFKKDIRRLCESLKERRIYYGTALAFTNIDLKNKKNKRVLLQGLKDLSKKYNKVNIIIAGSNEYLRLFGGKSVATK